MKLFYKSGACSLASHIVLAEMNMVYELEAVDLGTKQCASGDFRKINPKGSVPALRMDNGEILTEGSAILQYLGDQKPEAGLVPRFGTTERYRCQEWLNFIATEVHKPYGMIFGAERIQKTAEAQNDLRTYAKETLGTRLGLISEQLGSNDYLLGKQFTVADAYLFTVLSWSKHVGFDLAPWENVTAYLKRVSERPGVVRAMKEEGILK